MSRNITTLIFFLRRTRTAGAEFRSGAFLCGKPDSEEKSKTIAVATARHCSETCLVLDSQSPGRY